MEGFSLHGFERVVVDTKAGLLEMAKDIQRGRLKLELYSTVVFTNAWADMLCNEDLVWVLERLQAAIQEYRQENRRRTIIYITGPMPSRDT